ncbi:MAG: glycosyltransferase family 2 protein [Planctomycetia bacterium]|nr:glycosyltransferase family 2 protein [Planctomycetia bacterium]
MAPKVSIIIPVYNVEKYLRRCLDSVVGQTMREIEIICVNDGSTDGSLAILEEYAQKEPRILLIDTPNAGVNHARNIGLERMTGEYFLLLDSDDWVEKSLCEKAYAKARQTEADMTFFYFDMETFPQEKRFEHEKYSTEDAVQDVEKVDFVVWHWTLCWCYLWKTSFFRKHGLKFREELHTCTEIPTVLKAAILTNKIVTLPEVLHHYRYREDSLTGKKDHPRFLQRPAAFSLLWEDLEGISISEACRDSLFLGKWISISCTYYDTLFPKYRRAFLASVRKELLPGEREALKRLNRKEYEGFKAFMDYCYTTNPLKKIRWWLRHHQTYQKFRKFRKVIKNYFIPKSNDT